MYVFIDTDTNSSTCIMQYPPDLSVFKNCFCPACRRDASKINRNIFGHIIQK